MSTKEFFESLDRYDLEVLFERKQEELKTKPYPARKAHLLNDLDIIRQIKIQRILEQWRKLFVMFELISDLNNKADEYSLLELMVREQVRYLEQLKKNMYGVKRREKNDLFKM